MVNSIDSRPWNNRDGISNTTMSSCASIFHSSHQPVVVGQGISFASTRKVNPLQRVHGPSPERHFFRITTTDPFVGGRGGTWGLPQLSFISSTCPGLFTAITFSPGVIHDFVDGANPSATLSFLSKVATVTWEVISSIFVMSFRFGMVFSNAFLKISFFSISLNTASAFNPPGTMSL